MSLIRFAKVLDFKYNLLSTAAPPVPGSQHSFKLEDAVALVHECYNNYLNPSNALNTRFVSFYELAFQTTKDRQATLLFPFFNEIASVIQDLDEKANSLTPIELFNSINDVLAKIKVIQDNSGHYDDEIKKVVSLPTQAYLKDRGQTIAKWKKILFEIIADMLHKAAKITKGLSGSQEKIKGGPTDAGITELSLFMKEKFLKTPEASAAGLRDLAVFEVAWSYPDLRPLIHRYINTVLSGKTGSNSIKFRLRQEALAIKKMFEEKSRNNQDFFEAGEDEAVEMARPKVVSPQLRKELDLEEAAKLERDQVTFDDRKQKVDQRDMAHKRRTDEKEALEAEEALKKQKELEKTDGTQMDLFSNNMLRINRLLKRYTQ